MPRSWEVVLFAAAIFMVAFLFVRQARRRRRPVRFPHAGAMYRRDPDGSFTTDAGLPVAGATTIGVLAATHRHHCDTNALSGGVDSSSSSDSGSDAGGDGGGGDGGSGGD